MYSCYYNEVTQIKESLAVSVQTVVTNLLIFLFISYLFLLMGG